MFEGKVKSVVQFILAGIAALGAAAMALGINIDIESLKAIVLSGEARVLAVVTAVVAFMPSIPQTLAVLQSDAPLDEKINAFGLLAVAAIVCVGAIAAVFGVTLDIAALKSIAATWQTKALGVVAAVSAFLPSIPKLIAELFGSDQPAPVEEAKAKA